MLNTSQIISSVLIFPPLIVGILPVFDTFDLSYRETKKKFLEIGKSLKEKKIYNWRKVFIGANADGFSDEYVAAVLNDILDGDSLGQSLKFSKRCFDFYYIVLFIIFSLGVIHGVCNLTGQVPQIISYINNYSIEIITGTLLYIVLGMAWLFIIKNNLEKKSEKYNERF